MRGYRSDLVRGRGGGVLQRLEERWIRGQLREWGCGEGSVGGVDVERSQCEYSGTKGEALGEQDLGWGGRERGGGVKWVITGAQRGEACNQPALRKECSSSSRVITAI